MAIYNYTKINVGGQANDGTGDNIRDAFVKTNNALDLLFTLGPTNVILSDIYNTATSLTNLIDSILATSASTSYVDNSIATLAATTATDSRLGLVKIGSNMASDSAGRITLNDIFTLNAQTAAPGSPAAGMFAVADGVNWNPASKVTGRPYPVFYDGAGWTALY